MIGLAAPVCTPLTPLPVRPSAASATACPQQDATHPDALSSPAATAAGARAVASASHSPGPPAWIWAVIAAVLAASAVLFLRSVTMGGDVIRHEHRHPSR